MFRHFDRGLENSRKYLVKEEYTYLFHVAIQGNIAIELQSFV